MPDNGNGNIPYDYTKDQIVYVALTELPIGAIYRDKVASGSIINERKDKLTKLLIINNLLFEEAGHAFDVRFPLTA